MTFREFCRVKNVELTQKYNVYAFQLCVLSMCMFLMNIEVFLQIFLWFKFCTSVQICIYLPTFVLIYTLCDRCCPTEHYIRTVRIPGNLWLYVQLTIYLHLVANLGNILNR